MNAKNPAAAHAHPVVLLARAVGMVFGLVLLLAHVPALWPAVGGLVAYALALVVQRGSWPAGDPGRAART